MNRFAGVLLAAVALSAPEAVAQGDRPPADLRNVSYGPFEANVLDLWKAKSAKPSPLVVYIHGGGFQSGDKRQLPTPLLVGLLNRGISVSTINYRLTDIAPFPAPMLDGARAVQFLRSKAREWNLDRERFAAAGGSAGAGIALWTAFHPDLADSGSADSVLTESTRLRAIAVQNAQTSYDPRWIRTNVGPLAANHPALKPFFALKPTEMDSPQAHKLYEEASPISYLSADAPPVFIFYSYPGLTPEDLEIHSMKFGEALKVKMDALRIECVIKQQTDYKEPGLAPNETPAAAFDDMLSFLAKYLLKPDPGR